MTQMRLFLTNLVCFLFINLCYSQQDCQHKANIIITTLNFTSGCPFGDSGGIDPVLEILNPDGSQLYIMHIGNLDQVTGPVQDFVVDFSNSGNPNACPQGNFSTLFCLGPQPVNETTADFTVRIYEKDSNFFNSDCGGYNFAFDSNFGEDQFIFDFTQPTGTIDVGSCISFNYDLTLQLSGSTIENITGPICPDDNITIEGTVYDRLNPKGQISKPGNGGCDTLIDINLSFFDAVPIVQFGESMICPDSQVEIGIANEVDYTRFEWNNGEVTSSISISEPGEYRVTATSSEGCLSESNFVIDTFNLTPVSIIGEDQICENSISDLNISGNHSEVLWSTGDTSNLIFITVPGIYSVTTTDNNGCTGVGIKTVTQSPSPSITFIGDQEICDGESTTLVILENHADYLWNDQSEDSILTITEPGIYSLTVTDFNDCTANSSTLVTVFDLPRPSIAGGQDFCFGDSIVLSSTDAFESYLWNDNSTADTLVVSDSGNFQLIVTDINGCTGSVTTMVNENNEITPFITGDLDFCSGDTGTIALDQNYPTITWNDNSTDQTLEVSTPGIYAATVTDNTGCSAVTQTVVTVMDQLQPSITGGNILCEGSGLTLGLAIDYTSQIWSDGTTESKLTLNLPGTYSVTVTDNQGCTGTAEKVIDVTPIQETLIQSLSCDPNELGTFMFTVPSTLGCDSIVTTEVSFDPSCTLMTNIKVIEESCPESIDGEISVNLLQGNFPVTLFLVLDSDTLQSMVVNEAMSTVVFIGVTAGEYDLLVLTNSTFISESFSVTVGQNNSRLEVPEEFEITEGNSIILDANLNGINATTYGWWDGQEAQCSGNCLEISVSPSIATTYTFIAENIAGCLWQDSTRVIVNSFDEPTVVSDIYRPNIFNPEASGENSTFKLFSGDANFIYSIEIYDRFGNLVFVGDQSNGWDGNYRGKSAEAGVYVYKVTKPSLDDTSTSQVISGSLSLIR